MKNILTRHFYEGQILKNARDCLFAIALAAIAFNCEAWNIEDQKTSLGLTTKEDNKLYYGESIELTTQKGENLRDSLYNCEKIIEYAWNKRYERDKNFITQIKKRVKGQDLTVPAIQNGLTILYAARKYFKYECQIFDAATVGEVIEKAADAFGFNDYKAKTLEYDIKWYLNNEKWLARRWFENVQRDVNATEKSNRIVCHTAKSYLQLKKQLQKSEWKKLHIVLDFTEWQELSSEEQGELRKAKNKVAEFKVILTMKDFNNLYDGNNEFTISSDVTNIESDVLNEIKKLNLIRYEITKDASNFDTFYTLNLYFFNRVKVRINEHDIDIEIGNFFSEGDPLYKCRYNDALNIPQDYKLLLQKLDIYFESCNDLIKAVSNSKETNGKQLKPKDIIELIEKFKKKHGCKGVKARLTKGDIEFYKNGSSITIPEYVIDIDDDAFAGREDITEMTIEDSLLCEPSIYFADYIKSLCVIYVPKNVNISNLKENLENKSIEIKHISDKPKE